MKKERKLVFIILLILGISFVETKAEINKSYSVENVLFSAGSPYIRSFSSLPPQTENRQMLVPGILSSYEQQLSEINNRTTVKVYVLLINGLSLPHYCAVPENSNSIPALLGWSKSQKKLDEYSYENIKEEATTIAQQISGRESIGIRGPVIFCSLIQYDIKYGKDSGKKITLYHSSSYNFDGSEQYLTELNDRIRLQSWSQYSERNLSQLISTIRQTSQKYINDQYSADEKATLREKLMNCHKRYQMESAIDTLDQNLLLGFDHELRAHVVLNLLRPSDTPPIANSAGMYSMPTTSFSPANALLVLENIDDYKIKEWFDFINTSQSGKRSVLNTIINSVSDGYFSGNNYQKFMMILNKQIKINPDFHKKLDDLLLREDILKHVIAWEHSSLFSTDPIGTNTYEVNLTESGKLRVVKSTVVDYRCYNVSANSYGGQYLKCDAIKKKEPAEEFNPFDLVLFINRSELSLLSDATKKGNEIHVVPAIYLLYAKDKKWNQNIKEGFSLGFDLVTLAIPVAKLKYGPQLYRNIVFGIDIGGKVGSIAQLPITLGSVDENYKEVVEAYNGLVGILALGPFSVDAALGVKKMAQYVRAVSKYETELLALAGQDENINYLIKLRNTINQEASAKKGADWLNRYAPSVNRITQRGEPVKSAKNLIDIDRPVGQFKELKDNQGKRYRAANFWNAENENLVHFISKEGKYYIKHDPNDGRVLFLQIDVEPKRFLGFALDEDKLIGSDYDRLLNQLKTINGLQGGATTISLGSGSIKLVPNKANVLIGKTDPNKVPGISGEIGTDDVLKEMPLLKLYEFAVDGINFVSGTMNVLATPENINSWKVLFEERNKEYLDEVIENPDAAEITFVTYPHQDLMFVWNGDQKQKSIIGQLFLPSGFAREIKYLKSKGVSRVRLKDGRNFDLKQLDLENIGLDWTDWIY